MAQIDFQPDNPVVNNIPVNKQNTVSPTKIDFQPIDFQAEKQPKKNLITQGFTPEQLVTWADSEPNPIIKKLKQVGVVAHLGGKDMITIPAHFFNQMFLNYPRSIANTFNIEYPEKAENKFVNLTAKGAGIAGAFTSPLLNAISTLGRGAKVIEAPLRMKALAGSVTGAVYAPTENVVGLKERTSQAITGGVLGAGTPLAIKGIGGLIKNTPQAIETIKNIPNKFFRGGLTKSEALRVESKYGSSNGSLVEIVKNKLGQMIKNADDAYSKVFQNTPENKFINIRPSIEEAGRRLKRLGLVTEKGNLTELGQSEIARDSTYGKLLDFYKSADAISGVEKLQGKGLTQGQMVKSFKAMRETLVNKDQFLFLRDKLNSLYKDKPSDIDVSRVVDRFYQSGENSGLKGLQAARQLERTAFYQEGKFLNRNTGDLKIATESKLNRIGTKKSLSRAEINHIRELQDYVEYPIIKDAASINKLNRAKETIKVIKKYGTGVAVGGVGGEVVRKVVTGNW